ncbi:MAG: hypothetical protein CMP93_00715 [Gammaproteobacteria bacterium]|nr:hypothetical protein [Gammaproteobacteria bacterium]
MPQLTLIRHAASKATAVGQRDFDRVVSEEGILEIARTTDWLSQNPLNIDWAWSSPSVRTRTTANSIFKSLDCEFFYLPALYLASLEELTQAIQTVPKDIEHLAIIGHNPGLSQLASFLMAKEHPQFNMNTMELLSYEIKGNFEALRVGCGELLLQKGNIAEA